MKNSRLILRSFINAFATFLYVTGLSWFMFNGEKFIDSEDNFLMPVMMLMLFLTSATITATLVLGKPIQLYLENLKNEAVILLLSTIGWLAFFLISVFAILASK